MHAEGTCNADVAHERGLAISLTDEEAVLVAQSVELELISLGEQCEHAQTSDDLQRAVERAQTLARLLCAAENGRLPVESSVVAKIRRWRAEIAQQLSDERRTLERIRAREDGYRFDALDWFGTELAQRGIIAEVEQELEACTGILARVA